MRKAGEGPAHQAADSERPSGEGAVRRSLSACMLLALVVAGVSFAAHRLFLDEQTVLLSTAPLLTLAVAAAVWWGRPGALVLVERLAAPMVWPGRRALWTLTAATLAALLLVAVFVLDRFANSGDEYAYILQAQTYAQGRLWAQAPPLPDFLEFSRFFAKDGVWISPYQPGWAALLAPAAAAGFPLWAVNPLLGAATVPAFFGLARQLLDRPAAWLATLALASSPFFIFNFASYFSHGAAGLAGILFALFAIRYLKTGRATAALLAGLFLGYLGFVRAFNAALFAIPFGITLLLTPKRRIGALWFALAGAPFLIALLAYYAAVTGDPLTPVQDWYHPGAEPLGAPNGTALVETARRLVRLHFWTSPVMLFAWAAALVQLARSGRLHFIDWIMPITLAAFVFYGGHGGNQYGPRYLFEAWPFALLSVMRALEPLLAAKPRTPAAAWAASALIAHLTFQASYALPRMWRDHEIIIQRQDLYRQVARAGLDHAVVIVASGTSVIHPMMPEDLTRNGLRPLDARVIYALDLGPRTRELRARFPDRDFFIYAGGVLTPAPAR